MINFWYQLDWKIQYSITIILIILVLQLGAMPFYTNTDRNIYIQSEEDNKKDKIIKEKLKRSNRTGNKSTKNNIEGEYNSIEMRQAAIAELYLNENDFSSGEVETVEAFQNRSNIVNYNLQNIESFDGKDTSNSSNSNSRSKKVYDFKIHFFKPSNTFQLFENNQYIDRMNAINLKARKFNSKAELTLKYMQSLLKISKKEKTKTYQLVENMLMRLEKSEIKSILPTFLRETLQICNLAKSAEWLEGGMPHTHDKTVILPENWFKEVTSYFKDLDNKIAFNGSTLMHELLHIHQRIKPDLYENIYREWGFIKVDFMDNMGHILELNRNNPDGMQDKWVWVDRSQRGQLKYYWIGALIKTEPYPVINQVNYYAYQMNKIENTHEKDIKIVRLSENPPILLSEFDSFNNYFGITNNHYHPNEIVAQYVEEFYGEVLSEKIYNTSPAYEIFKMKWSLHY